MAQDKYGYIPPSVQANMTKHLQQSLPTNLKQYAGGNTYIPERAEKQIMAHMQKSLPGHMKQYASSYMHQQSTAGVAALANHTMPTAGSTARPAAQPVTNYMRRDHSNFGEQFNIDTNDTSSLANPGTLSFSPQYQGNASGSAATAPANSLTADVSGSGNVPPPTGNPYDFIMNPGKPKKPVLLKGGKKPLLFIIGVAAAVVVLLIIVFSVLSSGNKGDETYLKLAQEQQEIGRVANLQFASLQQDDVKDFAITTTLTMQSDESTLVKFAGARGLKMSTKNLDDAMNATTDTKLTAAIGDSTLDSTLTKELQTELTSYQGTLRQAYAAATGPQTRALLKQFNDHANLLLDQSKQ